MEVFSPFAFKFGILLFFCICLHNLVFSWLCILFHVRIEKFALLYDSWDKYIFKRTINQTEYILGWLPFGGYIKVFGMVKDDDEINRMLEEEKQYALIYKPKIQQQIFKASPYLVWPLLLLLFVYLINPQENFFTNLESVFVYTINALKSMFGFTPKAIFESYSREVSSGYQLLPFSLLVSCITFVIFTPFSSAMQMFADDKKSKLKRVVGTILIFVLLYLVLWKIPAFAFSFFTFGSVLKYIFSILIGIYIASFVTYWLIVPLIKLNKTK
ncbi:MAG: site-2 protease family protein [Flavobacteriales bacterium]